MIREAKLEDEKKINELGLLINENYTKLFNYKKIMASNFDQIYVYEKDNIVLGYVHIIELLDTIDLINIVVEPNSRNLKIGSKLLESIIAKNKDITLEVSVDNINAISLYKKYDFKILNIRKKYYQDKDAYLMKRSKV